MARIRSLQPGNQLVAPHPTETDCFYQVVADSDGNSMLHLSTFGSDDRASGPKSSQSLQLSETTARELVKVIESIFGPAR